MAITDASDLMVTDQKKAMFYSIKLSHSAVVSLK